MLVRLTSRIMDHGVERPAGALVEVDAESSWVARGLALEVAAEPRKPVAAVAPVLEAAPAIESVPVAPAAEPEPIVVASPPPAPPRRRGRHTE